MPIYIAFPFSGLGETGVKIDNKRQTWPNFKVLYVGTLREVPNFVSCEGFLSSENHFGRIRAFHPIKKNVELPKCPPGLLIRQTVSGLSA